MDNHTINTRDETQNFSSNQAWLEMAMLSSIETEDDLQRLQAINPTFTLYGDEYALICQYHISYGHVPPKEVLAARNEDWNPPGGEFDHWFSEYQRVRMVNDAKSIIRNAAKTINEDPDASIEQMMTGLQGIGHYGPDTTDDTSEQRDQSALLEFPIECLPGDIRDYVEAQAKAIGCPPEFIAVPFLAVAGAVMGYTRVLRIKKSWWAFPILWPIVVASPSTGKTPALKAAMDPMLKSQSALSKAHQAAVKKAKEDGDDPPPPLEILWTDNATEEALGKVLLTSAGVAVVNDEQSGWFLGIDRYHGKESGGQQFYMKLHAGAQIQILRMTRPTITIDDPVVGITGCFQPDKLSILKRYTEQNDGFIARFLFSWPIASPPGWSYDDVEDALSDEVERIFGTLRYKGTILGKEDRRRVYDLYESGVVSRETETEAGALFVKQSKDYADAAFNATGVTAAVYGKAPEHLARLALILHVLSEPDKAYISLTTMQNADKLMEYFLDHTIYTLDRIQHALSTDARRVLSILLDAGRWMSKTNIRDMTSRKLYGDRLDRALQQLLDRRLIESQQRETTGRKATEYRATSGEQRPSDASLASEVSSGYPPSDPSDARTPGVVEENGHLPNSGDDQTLSIGVRASLASEGGNAQETVDATVASEGSDHGSSTDLMPEPLDEQTDAEESKLNNRPSAQDVQDFLDSIQLPEGGAIPPMPEGYDPLSRSATDPEPVEEADAQAFPEGTES